MNTVSERGSDYAVEREQELVCFFLFCRNAFRFSTQHTKINIELREIIWTEGKNTCFGGLKIFLSWNWFVFVRHCDLKTPCHSSQSLEYHQVFFIQLDDVPHNFWLLFLLIACMLDVRMGISSLWCQTTLCSLRLSLSQCGHVSVIFHISYSSACSFTAPLPWLQDGRVGPVMVSALGAELEGKKDEFCKIFE